MNLPEPAYLSSGSLDESGRSVAVTIGVVEFFRHIRRKRAQEVQAEVFEAWLPCPIFFKSNKALTNRSSAGTGSTLAPARFCRKRWRLGISLSKLPLGQSLTQWRGLKICQAVSRARSPSVWRDSAGCFQSFGLFGIEFRRFSSRGSSRPGRDLGPAREDADKKIHIKSSDVFKFGAETPSGISRAEKLTSRGWISRTLRRRWSSERTKFY